MGQKLEIPYTHGFMVHVPNLLSETFINACRPKDLAALQIPLNIFVRYLNSVAERCAELNDLVLVSYQPSVQRYEEHLHECGPE